MAVSKQVPRERSDADVIERARDLWTRRQKPIIIIGSIIILLAAGYLGYKYMILAPKEKRAAESMFKAEEYYRLDSMQKALHGDGLQPGFLTIIDKYGGTKSGKLARYYAGVAYVKLGDNQNAVNQLKKFKTSSKQIQTRAYKLLGDAYAELGQNDEAISYYKKAADHFPEDEANACEALYFAAGLSEKAGKREQAIEYYKELKEKYPTTQWGFEADKYLAKHGVYN